MSESPQPAPKAPENAGWDRFANDANVRDKLVTGVLELIVLLKTKLTMEHSSSRGDMRDAFLMVLALALVIIIPVTILTYYGKMSPDAATFVFGALTGAAFAFARDFIPPRLE